MGYARKKNSQNFHLCSMETTPSAQTILVHDHIPGTSAEPPIPPEHARNLNKSILFPPWKQIIDYPLKAVQTPQNDPHAVFQCPQSFGI